MTEEISPQMFQRLVELASLELGPEESEYLRRELNRQLHVVNELAAIPIDPDTPIASHGVPYPPEICPLLRNDLSESSGLAQDILNGAPETDDGYFVVPDIPHEDL